MTESIQDLEQKLDQLIAHTTRLNQELNLLKARERMWLHERSKLIGKNETVRTRVEAMITRLKSLEPEE